MKKLMVVAPYFYPKIGGMENYAWNISKGLKEKYGWNIIVITSNHIEKKYKEEKLNGLKIYRLPYWFKISNTPINPLWYFQIKKIIKKEKPDVINTHSPVPYIADITALCSNDIPLIITYHALSLYKQKNNLFNIIVWIYKNIEKNIFIKSNYIIVVSRHIRKNLPLNLQNKTKIIENSIQKKEIPVKIIENNRKKNEIIFIGSLDKAHSWKGLDIIIAAIKEYINNFDTNIKLTIIGDGNWKQNYIEEVKKLKINKYVKFIGAKQGKDKNKYLKNSKLSIIYPKTSNDALPTFLLESWAYSLPVIASDIIPISNLIRHKIDGYLIKPNSATELSRTMNKILTNKKLVNTLIKNGYYKVKKTYTWDKQIHSMNKLLKTI